jgi:hypothetical protein
MKKTEDKIINASSQNFPMKTFYGNVSPKHEIKEKPSIRLFPDLRNGFNNESPDFFRMDSMKENMTGYKNPYLNVVKTLDRSLFYKNNQSCIEHIDMINKIKSRKEYSQNPKILKQLCYSTDIDKLENKLHKESKITPYLFKTVSSDFSNPEYIKKIKILNGEYTPNHHYFTKGSFDLKKINENQFFCSKEKNAINGQTTDNFLHNENFLINNNNKKNINYENTIKNKDKKFINSNKSNLPSNNTVNKNIPTNDIINIDNNSKTGYFDHNLDKDKLANYNINLNDMERAIEKNNILNINSNPIESNILPNNIIILLFIY